MSRPDHVSSPDTQQALAHFSSILEKCCFHQDPLVSVQNNFGGHVSVTSTGARLFSSLPAASHPIIRIIISACQQHSTQHQLYTAYLCTELVRECCRLPGSLHSLITNMLAEQLTLISRFILDKSAIFHGNTAVDWSCAIQKMASEQFKPWLYNAEVAHFVNLILQVFVRSLPDGRNADRMQDFSIDKQVCVELCDAAPPESSAYEAGLFVHIPHVGCGLRKLVDNLNASHKDSISVAVVTISMSGDSDDFLSCSYRIETASTNTPNDIVLEEWVKFIQSLIQHGLQFLVCQKVIHPKLKKLLEQNGILYLDRLGNVCADYMMTVSSAIPISSLVIQPAGVRSLFGKVERCSLVRKYDKEFLWLQNESSQMHTIFVCSHYDEMLEELKAGILCILTDLQTLLLDKRYLEGGPGWIERALGKCLLDHLESERHRLCDDLGCSLYQTDLVGNVLVKVLTRVASLYENDGRVITGNNIHVTRNILHTWEIVVQTAALVIGIGPLVY